MSTRIEKDSMGEMKVPSDAYYGASTARAVENFPVSGQGMHRGFLRALGLIKRYAATVNCELGLLPAERARAIEQAAEELADGKLDAQMVVDVFQTGSGTSTNMNANEVIANRATELMGGARGSKLVHPNDDVNMGQSSNDVIPTAMLVSASLAVKDELVPALERLEQALEEKSRLFWDVIKTGRTHLQDATPIRLGQVFRGFAGQARRSAVRMKRALNDMVELPLGGTAVGTGVNTHPDFASRVIARVSERVGHPFRETDNHFCGQNNIDSLLFAAGCLRTVAMSLHKIGNDIRWLGSGPRAGLGELALPAVQPGSSIMPGKVNPVIVESMLQAVAHVMGADAAVLHGGYGSYFELNMMFPQASWNFDRAVHILAASVNLMAERCVAGLEATKAGPDSVERGLMLGTALAPAIGYDKAAEIAKEAARTGRTIREVARERTDLSDADLARLLDAAAMTAPEAVATGA